MYARIVARSSSCDIMASSKIKFEAKTTANVIKDYGSYKSEETGAEYTVTCCEWERQHKPGELIDVRKFSAAGRSRGITFTKEDFKAFRDFLNTLEIE